jgi:hypothetical protein
MTDLDNLKPAYDSHLFSFPSDAGAVYQGVNESKERELSSLAKEGSREAAGWFDQEIHYWTNTTPAPIKRWATPLDSAEEGGFACLPIHSHLL